MRSKLLLAVAFVTTLVLCAGIATARIIRSDTGGGTWNSLPWMPVAPSDADLQQADPQHPTIHWPAGLHVNPLGPVPSSFDSLPTPPNYLKVSTDSGVPAVVAPIIPSSDASSSPRPFFDAQVLRCFDSGAADAGECDTNYNVYYANSSNGVLGVDFEWQSNGTPYAQVLFMYLGSPKDQFNNPATRIYDATGADVGDVHEAWQIEFNCNSATRCPDGASLQWQGQIYTATASVLTTADTHSNGGIYSSVVPQLNEFVFNNGELFPPPGWLAATATALTSSATTVTVGSAVSFFATVSEVRGHIPTGTVNFHDGMIPLGTASLNSSGMATLTTSSLTVGTHNITAAYEESALNATSVSAAKQIVVNPPAPTITFSVSPTSIVLGQSATLSWTSANATTCTASNGWSGAQATTGTKTVTPAGAGTVTYDLNCTGGGGELTVSATLTVVPLPTATLAVAPTSIPLGQSAAITWSSTNATGCTASDGWIGARATSGTSTVTPAAAGAVTYTLKCTGAGGDASASSVLTVAPLPTATLSVSPTTVTLGSSATLTWSSTNATFCTASGAWTGAQTVSGTQGVTPSAASTQTYTVACTGAGGTANASVSLTVNAAPAPTPPANNSSGGGAISLWELCMLTLLLFARWAMRRHVRDRLHTLAY